MNSLRLVSALALTLAVLPATVLAAGAPSVSGRVMDTEGKAVANAVVFVQEALANDAAAAPESRTATMDQVNKTFVPGLLPIVVGTRVHFPNHDQIKHHVYSFSRTKSFELPLYKGEDALPVLFDKVGVVKLGCNIHDWMSAIILVLPTAHFAVTDAEGRFVLTDLPRGAYKLAAWHVQSKANPDETEQSVQVGAAVPEITFALALVPMRARAAMHGSRGEP